MTKKWLIIDGYNLLHQVDGLAGLLRNDIQLARHRLVRMVENTARRLAEQTTIVFDGREAGQDDALTSTGLEIYFSPSDRSADTVIEQLVERYPDAEKILVVTSDRAEATTVSSSGAQVMSASEFIAQCERDATKTIEKRTRPGEEPKLGDLFPEGL